MAIDRQTKSWKAGNKRSAAFYETSGSASAITRFVYDGDKVIFTLIPVPKFTNLYPKRGISVNLPQPCEAGLRRAKADMGFNRFKEPVAQILRA